jgi:hypothetical protein
VTNEEKLVALQSCVFTPNCVVSGFQVEEWGEGVRLFFANGVVLEAKVEDLAVRRLPDESSP